jgi:hypothetical protein
MVQQKRTLYAGQRACQLEHWCVNWHGKTLAGHFAWLLTWMMVSLSGILKAPNRLFIGFAANSIVKVHHHPLAALRLLGVWLHAVPHL